MYSQASHHTWSEPPAVEPRMRMPTFIPLTSRGSPSASSFQTSPAHEAKAVLTIFEPFLSFLSYEQFRCERKSLKPRRGCQLFAGVFTACQVWICAVGEAAASWDAQEQNSPLDCFQLYSHHSSSVRTSERRLRDSETNISFPVTAPKVWEVRAGGRRGLCFCSAPGGGTKDDDACMDQIQFQKMWALSLEPSLLTQISQFGMIRGERWEPRATVG